ncbi:MAG: hypothetical protein M5U15_04225 [Kiritimatiellae bacterium]|nr:hypothetical protein [Kiritimatiellia bacterium]
MKTKPSKSLAMILLILLAAVTFLASRESKTETRRSENQVAQMEYDEPVHLGVVWSVFK